MQDLHAKIQALEAQAARQQAVFEDLGRVLSGETDAPRDPADAHTYEGWLQRQQRRQQVDTLLEEAKRETAARQEAIDNAGRLQRDNQWEGYVYSFRGEAVSDAHPGTCDVLWPDGSTTTHEYRPVWEIGRYEDHGKSYTVRRSRLMTKLEHRGHAVDVDLCDLVLTRIAPEALGPAHQGEQEGV